MDKKLKNNLYFLAVSLITLLYIIFIVGPFGNENGAFSEGTYMKLRDRNILFAMSFSALVIYLLYFLKIYKNLKYFNFINYPLSIINSLFLFIFTFLSLTGYGLYFIFLIPSLIGSIIYSGFTMVYGIGQDIISWKEYNRTKKIK